MKLTNIACKNAKPSEKTYRMADGAGLYLEITPKGSKYWRMKYYFQNKEKRLAFGVYPAVSLKEARDMREAARKQLSYGQDPSIKKKEEKIKQKLKYENTFENVALDWHSRNIDKWQPQHAERILKRLKSDLFPYIGFKPIEEISAVEILAAIRKVEERGALDLTKRILQCCSQVFRYAAICGLVKGDPTTALKGALKPYKAQHQHYMQESELPAFIEKLEAYPGHILTKLGLKLVMHTMLRSIELRGATWDEIDFEKKQWRVPANRMKMGQEHIVPLTEQTIHLLKQAQTYSGNCKNIFPNMQNPNRGIMSENTLLYALYRMGYRGKATVHGFRATASTILNERGFPRDVIEMQLSHCERDQVRAAYNHAKYLKPREQMMQWWSNYLDGNEQDASNIIQADFGRRALVGA